MIHLFQLRGLLVNNKVNLIIALTTTILLIACGNEQQIKKISDDYLIINTVIKKNKTLILDPNNENRYLISTITKYNAISNDKELDSLKQNIGIDDNDLVIKKIFDKKQYNYLISQKHDSVWNINLVDLSNTKQSGNKTIRISKPIYTLDSKTALVSVFKETSMSIHIYQKTNNEWHFYKLISPLLIQEKLKFYKNQQ